MKVLKKNQTQAEEKLIIKRKMARGKCFIYYGFKLEGGFHFILFKAVNTTVEKPSIFISAFKKSESKVQKTTPAGN